MAPRDDGRDGHNGRHAELGLESMSANSAMRVFDLQPRWMKELLWRSPLNLACDAVARDDEREQATIELADLERESARAVWGADHPSCALASRADGAQSETTNEDAAREKS